MRKEAINEAIHANPESFVAVLKDWKYAMKLKNIYTSGLCEGVRDFSLQNQCGIIPRIKEEVFQFLPLINTAEHFVQAHCESLRQHLNETAEEIEFAR